MGLFDTIDLVITLLKVAAVFLVIMLIIRAFWLWYWKVNRIEKLLEQIEENTRTKEGKAKRAMLGDSLGPKE